MKIIVPLMLASTLFISACANSPQDQVNSQAPAVHNYLCTSGATIAASYVSTDAALIHYKGSQYNMQIAVSGSGSRYVGGGLEWWTKGSGQGSEGTLFRHMGDGKTGKSIESCKGI